MAKEKKLSYSEIPKALRYVIKTLWAISPAYVLVTLFYELKDRLVPFATLFITAAVASRLPGLINGTESYKSTVALVALGVAIELTSRIITISTQLFRQRIENRVSITMREHFYQRYAALPYYLYEDKSVIDAFNYADEFMYRFSQFGLQQITRTVGGIVELIGVFIALTAVAWYLPIALIIFLPLIVRSVLRINREQMKTYNDNRPETRRMWAIESIFYPRRIKETRLYGVVDHFLAERRRLAQNIKDRELNVDIKQNKIQMIQDVQIEIAGLFASAIALWRIAYQGAPLGVFVLAQQLATRAGGITQTLFSDFSRFDSDLYGFAEYQYITEELQEKASGKLSFPKSSRPDVSIENLSFAYPGSDDLVLKDVSLDIPFGSSIAIVGENGAGKTTFTKLLLGLYKPASGTILLGGKDLQEYEPGDWLSRVGVLLQDFGINEDITIREAIWLGDIKKPKDDKLIWKAIDQVELRDMIEKLPHGLDTYLGKWIDEDKGTELSGGQLQRLAIARVLFRDPDVLIMDEPTSSVDANAEERIFATLDSSRKNQTTIFISHRFSTVRRADKIICMDNGKIVETGTHEELMAKKGMYHQMFTNQSKGYK